MAESAHDPITSDPVHRPGARRATRPRLRGPALLVASAVVAVVGFSLGLVLSGGVGRLVDDERAVEVELAATSTTAPTTTSRPSTTTVVPTTTASTAPPTTGPMTTTTIVVPTTTPPPPVTTALPPPPPPPTTAVVTTTTLASPVPTSVPWTPGSPPFITVAYAGQASGVLRIGPGSQSMVVLSNRGGANAAWTVQVSGYVTMVGGNRISGVLQPGQSVGLIVRADTAVPPGAGGALTAELPSGITVVPISVG